MRPNATLDERLAALDLELFARIPSETQPAERRSLLALQQAVRRRGAYVYLEIGSHLGGSIQPHLLDPSCRRIYSIDKRPQVQPDAWRRVCHYPENSTQRMLELLREVAPDQVGKIECFDTDTAGLDPARIGERPHLCFVDAEHTPEAVLRDFRFCMAVSRSDAVIAFHDCQIVFEGMEAIFRFLRGAGVRFRGVKLEGSVYAIALGDSAAARDPIVWRIVCKAWFRHAVFLVWRRLKRRMPAWLRRGLLPLRRVGAWALYRKPISDRRE